MTTMKEELEVVNSYLCSESSFTLNSLVGNACSL